MVELFKSRYHLFELSLLNNWQHEEDRGIYSFFLPEELEGVLQISAYVNKNRSVEFNIISELEKEKEKHPTAFIVDISHYKAVHYGLNDSKNGMLRFEWILGDKNIKLFCVLILNALQSEEKLDRAYVKTVEILNTIIIKSVR